MGDIRLVSYMREGIAGPKSTCFGEVRDKMGISPIFLASATRPRNIQDNGSMVWAPLPTGVYGVLPGPASPSPPHLIVLSWGPLRSPAHSQVRTDASQGSELLLAGLPHTSSPQRASALQLVLSLSQADLHLPRGSSRFLQVPPPCFPQTAQAPSANTLELHGAVEIAWLWNLEAGFQFRRWVHEVLGTSFSIS